jgi:nickel transport protein
MRAFIPVAFAAVLMLPSTAALAHHTWLSRDAASGDVVMLWGHPGHDPEGPNKGAVVELKVYGPDGKATEISARLEKKGAPLAMPMPEGKVFAVAGFTDNGFMVDTADRKYVRTNKLVVKDATKSIWSRQYAKMILPGATAAQYAKPLGQLVEIVPMSDPYALKAGEKLKVKVLYQGKPVANGSLGLDNGFEANPDKTKFVTGPDGVAEVPLFAKQTVIGVYHRVPGTVPALADEDSLAATLCISGLK